jgi:hypothetical protein
MKPAVWRLLGAVVLFAGWVGYLGYLAATTRNPVVVSRPQLLVSNLDVVAHVESVDGEPKVAIEEVLWPRDADSQKLVGASLDIVNLADSEGWKGAGSYILPLTRGPKDTYRITAIPRSPGYERQGFVTRIYPATPATRAQLNEIPKPEVPELPVK